MADTQMSLAASYVMASRVRAKLTKHATNAKTPLRTLVLQANMLDNIMDHLSQRRETPKSESKVHFNEPERSMGPQVHEYEVDSDSDSDSDSDEEDFYFSSDDEESDELEHLRASVVEDAVFARKAEMPVIDLSDDSQLSVIVEEEEDELPELTRSHSTSDSDYEEDAEPLHFVVSSAAHLKSTDSLIKAPVGPHDETILQSVY